MTREEIVQGWAKAVAVYPWLTCAWLFGSMARGDVVPGSDIDLRVGVYYPPDDWWRILSEPFGEYLLATIGDHHVRLVLRSGYVVDLGHESAPPGLIHVTEHRPVRRLIEKTQVMEATTEDTIRTLYPAELPTAAEVGQWIAETLVNMLSYPAMVARQDEGSRRLYCSFYRVDLAKLIYRLERVQWAKGFKHMKSWTSWAGELGCSDTDIWGWTILVLRLLAAHIDTTFPQDIVGACFARYNADMKCLS